MKITLDDRDLENLEKSDGTILVTFTGYSVAPMGDTLIFEGITKIAYPMKSIDKICQNIGKSSLR